MPAEIVPLSHEEHGRGHPVVLLHAFPFRRRMWAPQIEALSASCRLVLPDLRGFGSSPPGSGPASMEAMAGDVLALCDRLGLERFVLGGLSMGGYVAMALLRAAPGRIKALMLADTRAGEDTDEVRSLRRRNAARVRERGSAVLEEVMIDDLLAPGAATLRSELRRHVRGMIREASPEGAAAALEGMALRPDSLRDIERFAGPLLALVGEEDRMTPPKEARRIVDAASEGRLAVLPGAGHLSNLEAPAAFNAEVSALMEWAASTESES